MKKTINFLADTFIVVLGTSTFSAICFTFYTIVHYA